MIITYFLRGFFYYCTVYFALLTAVFASCNIFIRLPVIQSFSAIPILILTMLPLMALFSLPLASSLAVYATIVQHGIGDELIMLTFLKNSRRALHTAALLFSLFCGALYMTFVFQLAPQSYRLGKQMLFALATEHLLQLEPNKFHNPFGGCTFFFKKKGWTSQKEPIFTTLFLAFTNKDKKGHYFFSAEQGVLKNNRLLLMNGAIHTRQDGRYHVATFQDMSIDLNKLINKSKDTESLKGLKFLTLSNLLEAQKSQKDAILELHKRFAQILWQILLPLLALFLTQIARRQTILSGLITTGSLYLLSYVLLALGQAYHQHLALALTIFYLPIILLFILGGYFYYKRLI